MTGRQGQDLFVPYLKFLWSFMDLFQNRQFLDPILDPILDILIIFVPFDSLANFNENDKFDAHSSSLAR